MINLRGSTWLPNHKMDIQILQEILEDADVFGYEDAGAYADVYDPCAKLILKSLSKDLSIDQIQNIIWESFYQEFCVCTIGNTDEPWVLDRDQAKMILGSPDRYKDLAFNIRHTVIGL